MNKVLHYLEIIRKTGIKYWMGLYFRKIIINHFERFRLRNSNFSIISQNCIGGVMLHDLGQRFNTPTINLYFRSNDFLCFLENLEKFLSASLHFVPSEKKYPKAELEIENGKKVCLYFPHDNDLNKIENDWDRRKRRVVFDNLFIIMTDRDGLTEEGLKRFDNLSYKHKILLSHKAHPNYDFIQYYPMYSHLEQIPDMLKIITCYGKREYGQGWDYIKWLNS